MFIKCSTDGLSRVCVRACVSAVCMCVCVSVGVGVGVCVHVCVVCVVYVTPTMEENLRLMGNVVER